ncbi:GNAT family N-acetyltransferase [Pelagibacterium flavum]|uniref:GNAT family N-acetyltransferase n=1 Tax=Pelagibacterium flavum TaxID=2984530 RepID=A0ABY6IP77_9HYPH|nr:GNAT family N-acetyltransferase [Pelagibacterium sp. YIM 151497]MAN77598.1 GNAT family N-acetyltransferase [Hyphomicrobiales bacterium]UYQ72418.1 GNAT family N-acetyltransferase [Pelagibacterium sp. YIM 151497]|tara:strand:- start:396 stop:827 length:432 start_codon:yes stop_codon:yes gene_type:complete|eukprot:jgi/Tetstr1/452081/TSEL_039117.t1
MEIVFKPDPAQEDVDAVLAPLAEASEKSRPGANVRRISFLLKDPHTGAAAGGLIGNAIYEWLFINLLAVPESLRGQGYGAELMARAESWAREQNLTGMWLDTFAFQAPEFYAKLGFTPFGTINDHPAGSRRIFFQKRFAPHTA